VGQPWEFPIPGGRLIVFPEGFGLGPGLNRLLQSPWWTGKPFAKGADKLGFKFEGALGPIQARVKPGIRRGKGPGIPGVLRWIHEGAPGWKPGPKGFPRIASEVSRGF